MISIYWPRKKVPEWLYEVKVTGNSGPWEVYHYGFGVTAKRRGEFLVWPIVGTFIKVKAGGGRVEIKGQGGGVTVYFGFMSWWRRLARGLA